MADNVAARKQSGWVIVAIAPDVCKTPMGNSTPPVPYQVIAELETAEGVANSVRINGHPAVVWDISHTPKTIGDAPGKATGVKSGTVGGICWSDAHSNSVSAEKKRLVRHGDEFWMNGQ